MQSITVWVTLTMIWFYSGILKTIRVYSSFSCDSHSFLKLSFIELVLLLKTSWSTLSIHCVNPQKNLWGKIHYPHFTCKETENVQMQRDANEVGASVHGSTDRATSHPKVCALNPSVTRLSWARQPSFNASSVEWWNQHILECQKNWFQVLAQLASYLAGFSWLIY